MIQQQTYQDHKDVHPEKVVGEGEGGHQAQRQYQSQILPILYHLPLAASQTPIEEVFHEKDKQNRRHIGCSHNRPVIDKVKRKHCVQQMI